MRLVSTIIAFLLLAAPTLAATPTDPETVVRDAMAAAHDIPRQADALVRLAWPADSGDPAVASRARQEIVGFGESGLPALRAAIRKVHPEQQGDLVRAFIEARRAMTARIPADFLPGLEEAVWFGSEDARRTAIPELGRHRYSPAILTIMDAAHESSALLSVCMDALGKIGDERARFFLEKQLNEGKGETVAQAASALAAIGSRALLPLKAALRSDRRMVREAAARAFVRIAGPDDSSALAEYAATHTGDDATVLRSVHEATVMLEKLREAQEAAEAAGAETPRP